MMTARLTVPGAAMLAFAIFSSTASTASAHSAATVTSSTADLEDTTSFESYDQAVNEFSAGYDDFQNGLFEDAIAHFRQANKLAAGAIGNHVARTVGIEARYWTARALWSEGKLKDAEQEMRVALDDARVDLQHKPGALSAMTASLAGMRLELNENESAAALGEESYRLASEEASTDPLEVAPAAFFAGMAHNRMNHRPETEKWFTRALHLFAERPAQTRTSVMRGVSARILGHIQWADERYCEAQLNYELALSLPGSSSMQTEDMRTRLRDIADDRLCSKDDDASSKQQTTTEHNEAPES